MNALLERRRQDLAHLRCLESASGGRILVLRGDERSSRFVLELRYRTAGSDRFPGESLSAVQLTIDLPDDYPFVPPAATLTPVVFHPNVYASGRLCMGTKWLPAEGLDLFVRRVAEIVTFRPEPLNLDSPANPSAAHWFRQKSRWEPHWFPTDTVSLDLAPERPPTIRWRDVDAPDSGVDCPVCSRRLRVRPEPGHRVRCSACGAIFEPLR